MSNTHDPFENLNRKYAELQKLYNDNCDEAWEQIRHPVKRRQTERAQDKSTPSPQKRKKRRSGADKRTPFVVLAVVLALAVVGILCVKGLIVKPELRDKEPGSESEISIDYGDGIQPVVGGARKSEDYYTVLVLGRDTGGGGNTDTMLLASYDVTNQKATVMSIPRDTMVNVNWDVKKINSVYNMYGQGDKGIAALYKEVSQLVGFEPDYQVIVEWEAVGKLVDAIGGVYFDVPYEMNYHDPYQDLVIEQSKGYRLLDGEDAMQVIRWRKNDGGNGIGDSGRMEIQQNFLKAVIQQMMQPKNVMNIGKISKVFQENVETDLSFQNILWFGQQAFSGGLSVEDVTFLTMPWDGVAAYSRSLSKQLGYDFYLDYVVPIPGKLLDIVNEQLSPFEKKFTLRDLDIMSVNSDGSISSSTGHVEDSKAAVPPTLMGKKNDGEEPLVDENGNPIVVDENGNPILDENGNPLVNSEGTVTDDPNGEEPTPGETPDTPETGETTQTPETPETPTTPEVPSTPPAEEPTARTPTDGGGEAMPDWLQ